MQINISVKNVLTNTCWQCTPVRDNSESVLLELNRYYVNVVCICMVSSPQWYMDPKRLTSGWVQAFERCCMGATRDDRDCNIEINQVLHKSCCQRVMFVMYCWGVIVQVSLRRFALFSYGMWFRIVILASLLINTPICLHVCPSLRVLCVCVYSLD